MSTNAATAAARANFTSLPSSSKDEKRLVLPPPNRFAAALCGIAGSSAPGSVFASALLLSHHPLVCHSAKGAKSLWEGVMKRAFDGTGGVDKLLGEEAITASVTAALFDAMQGGVMHDR